MGAKGAGLQASKASWRHPTTLWPCPMAREGVQPGVGHWTRRSTRVQRASPKSPARPAPRGMSLLRTGAAARILPTARELETQSPALGASLDDPLSLGPALSFWQ